MPVLTPVNINADFNIAIVVSRFNQNITQKLLSGAFERLMELGFTEDSVTIAWVPGAVEIPMTAQRLARTEKFQGIICLGAVIFGETKHFEYVCQQVSSGCQQVALSNDIPVIFGVLTTENLSQAEERVGGKKGHAGRDAADTVYELISVLRQI